MHIRAERMVIRVNKLKEKFNLPKFIHIYSRPHDIDLKQHSEECCGKDIDILNRK